MLGLRVAYASLGSIVIAAAVLSACSSPSATPSGPSDSGLVQYPNDASGSGTGSGTGSGSGSGSHSGSGSGTGSLPGSGSGSGGNVCVFDDATSTFDGTCVFGN